MQLEIITPDTTLFSGTASAVSLPGVQGRFQVLENHAPLIASLGNGNVVVDSAQGREEFKINGGLIEVLRNKVVILA
ncbi:MAG: F0F1 ATP synthase subunit epsilon [Bacteroidia bacterium]|nr:F0F1 ATP synthase subunit epsilon [Bacteroidia bacterium]